MVGTARCLGWQRDMRAGVTLPRLMSPRLCGLASAGVALGLPYGPGVAEGIISVL